MASLARDLRHVLAVALARPESDALLLRRFVTTRDESAFAEIVRRHGPAVLRVCRSLLNRTDADDAFQATFFVLARRADSIHKVSLLAGWLVGVAGRVARQLRKAGWRRVEVEKGYRPYVAADETHEQNWNELNEELTRLPVRLRDPVVLCFLESKTQNEAAAELGQSVRTIRRRIEKAKHVLRLRLERRGVTPAVLAVSTPLWIPSDVAARTAAAAVQFLTGGVRSPAATLAKGFGMTTLLKLKVAAGLCAVVAGFTLTGVAQDPPEMKSAVNPTKSEGRDAPKRPMPSDPHIAPNHVVLSAGNNPTVSRVITTEALYQLSQLSKAWFGQPTDPRGIRIQITANLTGDPSGSTAKQFGGDNKLIDARLTVCGPLESILCDRLPCEIAHVVLAAHFGAKMPRWAEDGLALTVTSTQHQAETDAMIRQLLKEGKGIKLKVLFGMNRPDEVGISVNGTSGITTLRKKVDWAVFVTESTSVVRFLLSIAPRKSVPGLENVPTVGRLFITQNDGTKELIRFLELGMKENWDYATSTVYGLNSIGELEGKWLEWLMSDASRAGLPAVTPSQPPPVEADPARIPPVNLGK
ncbi:MAG TPA: sigma-70 family RNA polymerase sigma factor [Fimbriiglobus sp.]|jgi:RNA polymerase sigma factor (sigma-70 family)